jgi:hypothetical protein
MGGAEPNGGEADESKLPLLARLRELVQEFNRKAETIAQTIISEMSLPRAQKRYKPKTDMGGIAGKPPQPSLKSVALLGCFADKALILTVHRWRKVHGGGHLLQGRHSYFLIIK